MPPEGLHRITEGLQASLHPIDSGATTESIDYDSASDAIFAAFTTPPTTARKGLIDTCVLALKSAGVWTKLDALYVFAAADSQAAKINWKAPGTFNATEVNSPTFTADRGFTGNGTTSYLDTNFNPATATTPQYVQDSSCVFARERSSIAGSGTRMVGNIAAATIILHPRNASDLAQGRLQSTGTAATFASTNSAGFWSVSRTASTTTTLYKNGSSISTSATVSVAVTSAKISVLSGNSTFWAGQVASAGIAGGLTGANITALYNAEQAYMTGVGA